FQAEDGIRDLIVTGVQTCALPIFASMNNCMGWAVAVERMMGIEVPRRAEYIRVIISELQRIASHLMAFGTYGLDMGAFTAFMYRSEERRVGKGGKHERARWT